MSEWIVTDEDLGCDGAYFSYTQIVRCRDCKHYESDDLCGNTGCCKSTGLIVVHDWFCCDGERREE